MISKELLSAVLNEEIIHIFDIENNELRFNTNPNDYTNSINIHELAHMVKEWAMSYEYYIYSRCRIKNRGASVSAVAVVIKRTLFSIPNLNHSDIKSYNKDKTEPEAIFKAGEWLLKEITDDK
jgi:hypothetical protein